jgi:hypothetical protein
LTATLHADDGTITGRNWDFGFSVRTKVAYEGLLGAEAAGPIMLHAGALTGFEADLLLEHQNGETWEQVPLGFFCGGGMYLDDLPLGYRSAGRESFVCLRPGESWVGTLHVSDGDPWDFPPDVAQGDVFRLRHRGCVVDWWSWGNPEDLTAVLESFSAAGRIQWRIPLTLVGARNWWFLLLMRFSLSIKTETNTYLVLKWLPSKTSGATVTASDFSKPL